MNQTSVTRSVRHSSLALATALLAVLGLLAFQAHAEEETVCTAEAKLCADGTSVGRVGPDCNFAPCPTPVRDQIQENRQERKELYEENQEERQMMMEQNRGDVMEARENGELLRNVVQTNRGEVRAMLGEQRGERMEMRSEHREELRTALDERREQLRVQQEERRAAREERGEEYKARLEERLQDRLGGFVVNVAERMNVALDRLEHIASRIGDRISKIEEMHEVDLTDARDALADAVALIGDARADVADLAIVAEDILSSDDPKAGIDQVREAAEIAKESIKGVHTALSEAVQLVKAATPVEEEEAEGDDDDDETETTEEEETTEETTE